jgi:hypothetical protein
MTDRTLRRSTGLGASRSRITRTTTVKPGENNEELYQDAADTDPLETVAGLGCPGLTRRASPGCGGERPDRPPRFMR